MLTPLLVVLWFTFEHLTEQPLAQGLGQSVYSETLGREPSFTMLWVQLVFGFKCEKWWNVGVSTARGLSGHSMGPQHDLCLPLSSW